jgi:ribosomal protein RSM22 (predicted rRNA methylase)
VIARLWEAARLAFIIIEPGTPRGFALIREVRSQLLAWGAHMLAPCPREDACPVTGSDWCHFAARVERTSLHRRVKEAELNYEDEKFSYVAVVREVLPLPGARIVRRPVHQPGLITLETCTPRGFETVRATKRNREQFRAARQADWGDPFGSV